MTRDIPRDSESSEREEISSIIVRLVKGRVGTERWNTEGAGARLIRQAISVELNKETVTSVAESELIWHVMVLRRHKTFDFEVRSDKFRIMCTN